MSAPPLPARNSGEVATTTTTSDGHRIHDINEPIPDPSTLLSQRLDNWVHALGILQDYVDAYTSMTKKQIQGYEKVKKSIATLPRFSRYEGSFNGEDSSSNSNNSTLNRGEPEGGRLDVGKGSAGRAGFSGGVSRSSTMGSSEIVLGALSSRASTDATLNESQAHSLSGAKQREAFGDSLPSYSAQQPPQQSIQQRQQQLENNEFAPHNRGIDGLFEMLRLKNEMNLISLQNMDKQVKEQITPIFKELISEVTSYRKHFNHKVDKHAKQLTKISKSKKKIVSELESSISLYHEHANSNLRSSGAASVGSVIDYEKDPFLVKKQFFKNLNEQLIGENELVSELINLKEEIFALEIKIVATIKKLVIIFNNFQTNHFEEVINNLLTINTEFSLFDERFEISKFLTGNLDADTSKVDNKHEAAHKRDDLLLLLSSKLPNDNTLVLNQLQKDINYLSVQDDKLFNTINHDATVPILKEVITYQEIRKMSLKDKLSKNHYKNDYFALTKLKYLFVFGTENEIVTGPASRTDNAGAAGGVGDSGRLLTSVDRDFLKGELEPSVVFYLPKCTVIEDEDENDNSSSSSGNSTPAPAPAPLSPQEDQSLSRSKTFKSKIGSIKRLGRSHLQHGNAENERSSEYAIKFVGVDLNHRILSKFNKNAHKRTIVMKFRNREQYLVWNNLIREMSGDMQDEAEDYDATASASIGGASAAPFAQGEDDGTLARNESLGVQQPATVPGTEVAVEDELASETQPGAAAAATNTANEPTVARNSTINGPTGGNDLVSDHLNENFEGLNLDNQIQPQGDQTISGAGGGNPNTGRRKANSSEDEFSDPGADSIFELREAIKEDRNSGRGNVANEGRSKFVEDPESIRQ